MAITKHFIEQTPKTAWQLGLAGDEALECLCGGRLILQLEHGVIADSQETEAWHSTAKRHYFMDVIFPAHADEFWAPGRNGRLI